MVLDSSDFSNLESESGESVVNDLEVNEVRKVLDELDDEDIEFDSDSIIKFKSEEEEKKEVIINPL